ncbi:MAG: hypothetical protein JWO36_6020 [Myxococcales bacterium]|nr:hypothetical protein [Myxococcales bacterium]
MQPPKSSHHRAKTAKTPKTGKPTKARKIAKTAKTARTDVDEPVIPVDPSIVDLDPEDPTQVLDEVPGYQIEEVSVEAQPHPVSRADLETLVEADEEELDEDEEEQEAPEVPKDVGDLYGVHAVQAEDTELAAPEDQDSFQDSTLGENWLEALETKSAEGGPEPEHVIDVVDDSDADHPTHHKTDTRDRPVADKGSGGPGGL